MFGQTGPDALERPAAMELVRLALSRRVYTRRHLAYVAEVVGTVARRAGELRGYRIVSQPAALRHFTARFEALDAGEPAPAQPTEATLVGARLVSDAFDGQW